MLVQDAPLKDTKIFNDRRFVASFSVVNVTKRDAGSYRCMIRTEGGVGVSNYAELIVKGISELYIDLTRVRVSLVNIFVLDKVPGPNW